MHHHVGTRMDDRTCTRHAFDNRRPPALVAHGSQSLYLSQDLEDDMDHVIVRGECLWYCLLCSYSCY